MRVLHFFKTYWPDSFGGMERAIHAIARGTSRLGIEPMVLSLSRQPEKHSLFFDGHWAYKAQLDLELASTGMSLKAFKTYSSLAATADIIHCHFPWPFMDVVHLLTRPGKPLIVTYHSDIVRQERLVRVYRPLMNFFLRRANCIVATSPIYLETSKVLQSLSDKVAVIPIGLHESDYPVPGNLTYEKWRTRFPRPFFLFVGVFRYYKGLHILLNAAKDLSEDIVLVGTGPMERDLKEQAARLSLGNVHFVGALGEVDKIALLNLCTGFVFPSHLRSEAFGVALVEAAMAGKPMISCDIGTGTTFVNLHQKTGLVVPPEKPEALAAAMRRLAQDKLASRSFGVSARRHYEMLFKGEVMCERYARLYESMMQ